MQNRKNIGYDETKKMLDTMRRLTESVKQGNILKEEETDLKDDITVINDVDVKMLSTDIHSENKFQIWQIWTPVLQ